MFKRIILMVCLVLLSAGCAQCLLTRSEYYDITGMVHAPKLPEDQIEIFAVPPSRPYQEIGVVRILARYGTNHQALDEEMKRRAREAGADALLEPQYGEDKANKDKLCGRWFSTKRNISASAKAIIFTDEQAVEKQP